ncbi:MAG: MFS transporter [Pseudomonadota bacterium]
MRTILSFAALFLSVALMQLGSGGLGPLDALAGAAAGFTTAEIGLLGSAHFVGFFFGCWATPRLLGAVGHVRVFAAAAAIAAISALSHPLLLDPFFWAVLRVGSGAAVACAYTVVESWLQGKATNDNRGRIFSGYRVVDMTASVGAQTLVAAVDPGTYVAYNLIAALCCLCLLPLALTRATPPSFAASPRLRPLRAFRVSPLGALAVTVVGLTGSSFRMVGPIYAVERGLSAAEVGVFMASGVAGGALAQWPAGWLSDRIDRRTALSLLSAAALAVCVWIAFGGGAASTVYLAAFLFGAAAFPLYSVAASHANDFAGPGEAVELTASLMFLFGMGAIVSPLFAAWLIDGFGAAALFVYIGAAHLALILFGLWRTLRRPSPQAKTPHRYLPRTSFILGRLIKPKR